MFTVFLVFKFILREMDGCKSCGNYRKYLKWYVI